MLVVWNDSNLIDIGMVVLTNVEFNYQEIDAGTDCQWIQIICLSGILHI